MQIEVLQSTISLITINIILKIIIQKKLSQAVHNVKAAYGYVSGITTFTEVAVPIVSRLAE